MSQKTYSNKKESFPNKLLTLVKKEDKERFKQDYLEYNWVLQVIKEALENELEELYKEEESGNFLTDPNVVERQIAIAAKRASLRKTLNLFPKKQEK